MFKFVVTTVAMAALCSTVRSSETQAAEGSSAVVRVSLIDVAGKAVAGASVGFCAAFGNANFEDTGWEYLTEPNNKNLNARYSAKGILSDAQGIAAFTDGAGLLDRFAVIALHPDKKLMGIGWQKKTSADAALQVTMLPACHVYGALTCSQLEKKGGKLERVTVEVFADSRFVLEYWSVEPRFAFYLPPGSMSCAP